MTLYQQIPDCTQQVVKAAREKSAARRQRFMQREALNTDLPPAETTQGDWERTAQGVYRLASLW